MSPTPSESEAIGRRIRAFREVHEMTQAALAERCYVSQSAVTRWERGQRTPPRAAQHRIADALRVSRSALFRELVEAEDRAVAS